MTHIQIVEGTAKHRLMSFLSEQPDDSTAEQLFQELAFLRMVERGVADADAGHFISNEEMGRDIAAWSNAR